MDMNGSAPMSLNDLSAASITPTTAPAPTPLPGLNILNQWATQVRNDQVAKQRSAVVQQAIAQYKAGDIKGAFGTMGVLNPEGFGKAVNEQATAGPIAEETVRGQQKALSETGSTAGQLAEVNNEARLQAAEMRGEQNAKNKAESAKDKQEQKNDQWATQAWGKITVSQPFKNFQEFKVRENTLKNAATNPSAFGDIGSVFAFMKTLDPQSVVRESEYATAANAGSLLTRAKNAITKAEKGEILTPDQRKDLVTMTDHLGSIYKRNYDDFLKPVMNQANKRGIPMDMIDPYNVDENNNPKPTPEAAGALEFIKNNPNDPRVPEILKILKSKGL